MAYGLVAVLSSVTASSSSMEMFIAAYVWSQAGTSRPSLSFFAGLGTLESRNG